MNSNSLKLSLASHNFISPPPKSHVFKYLIYSLFTVFLFTTNLHDCNAQDNNNCGGFNSINSPDFRSNSLVEPWLTNCAYDRAILNNFIPDQNTGIKTVNIQLIVVQNLGGTGNFTTQHEDILKNFVANQINNRMANLQQYTLYQVPVTTIPLIPDSKIRYNVKRVKFVVDPELNQINVADPSVYNNEFSVFLKHVDLSNYDAIPVFLLENNNTQTLNYGGRAYATNGFGFVEMNKTFFGFQMSNSFSNFTETSFIHELGHLLGLEHSWDTNSGNTDIIDIVLSGSNGCRFSSSGVQGGDYCTNNYMSYNDGRTNFTPLQLAQMHRALISNPNYARTWINHGNPNSGFLSSDDIVITESTVWTVPKIIKRNIRVKSGATLTIKCKVLMPTYGSIQVEKGGHLIVDGGYITTNTNNNNERWNGIVVGVSSLIINGTTVSHDASTTTQGESGFANYTSIDVINHGIIENANTAIDAKQEVSVTLDNAIFVDNLLSLNTYNSKPTNITNTKFLISAADQSTGSSGFVRCYRTDISIFGGSFIVEPDYEKFNLRSPNFIGVNCFDGHLSISKHSNIRPNFKNVKTGIVFAPFIFHTKVIRISDTDIKNCNIGISVNGSNHPIIQNCKIELEDVDGKAYGIRLNRVAGFQVHDNEVIGTNTFMTPNKIQTGIIAFDCGAIDQNIGRNIFRSLRYANRADGINGVRVTIGNTGLHYTCNQNFNNKGHDFFTYEIKPYQGSSDDPAQNTFTHFDQTINSDFSTSSVINPWVLSPTNYYHNNIDIEKPIFYKGITPYPNPSEDKHTCPSKLYDLTGKSPSELLSEYAAIKNEINTLKNAVGYTYLEQDKARRLEFDAAIDNEQKTSIILNWKTNPLYIPSSLMLVLLYDQTISRELLGELITVHSYVLKDPFVKNAINQANGFSASLESSIKSLSVGKGEDIIGSNLNQLEIKETQLAPWAHEIAVRTKLGTLADANYSLEVLYSDLHQPVELVDDLLSIAQPTVFDSEDLKRLMDPKSRSVLQFVTDAISAESKFDSLDLLDLNYLTAIADVEDCKGAVLSQNLLNFFYGANYLRHPLDISENNANIEKRKANQGDTAKKENNVYVFPNPIISGERFTIHANGDVALEIWTLSGQLIKKANARGNEGRITVESAGMHPGIYLIRTYGSDGHTGFGKIIVK